eukprot:1158537-Pelagomonas_calceolata.AAC.24
MRLQGALEEAHAEGGLLCVLALARQTTRDKGNAQAMPCAKSMEFVNAHVRHNEGPTYLHITALILLFSVIDVRIVVCFCLLCSCIASPFCRIAHGMAAIAIMRVLSCARAMTYGCTMFSTAVPVVPYSANAAP